jgi:hypothetical protein
VVDTPILLLLVRENPSLAASAWEMFQSYFQLHIYAHYVIDCQRLHHWMYHHSNNLDFHLMVEGNLLTVCSSCSVIPIWRITSTCLLLSIDDNIAQSATLFLTRHKGKTSNQPIVDELPSPCNHQQCIVSGVCDYLSLRQVWGQQNREDRRGRGGAAAGSAGTLRGRLGPLRPRRPNRFLW